MSLHAPVRDGRARVHVRVRGTVQGVGFRPYVYRLAGELGLGGFVFNDAHGVVAEVEGRDAAIDAFLARLGGAAGDGGVAGERGVAGESGSRLASWSAITDRMCCRISVSARGPSRRTMAS